MNDSDSIKETIRSILIKELGPEHLDVINESDQHNVPPDSETHFKVIVVATGFDGLSRVRRHQAVYKVLAHVLSGPVHALALHTFTSSEWSAASNAAPDSPKCLGGGV